MAISLEANDFINENGITPKDQLARLTGEDEFRKYIYLHPNVDSKLFNFAFDRNLVKFTMGYVSALPQLKYWHVALDRLKILPKKLPPLPDNILESLFSNCPIMQMEGKSRQSGESYKVFETHSLYLIPPNSLNDLEDKVRAYGRDKLSAQNNGGEIFGFKSFYYQRAQLGNIASDHWEWALIPNTLIEESRRKCYLKQMETVEKLNQQSEANYEFADLRQIGAFLFLHQVATGVILYEADNNNQNRMMNCWNSVRVQETDENGNHLVIGNCTPSGITVNYRYDLLESFFVGIAVLRRLS